MEWYMKAALLLSLLAVQVRAADTFGAQLSAAQMQVSALMAGASSTTVSFVIDECRSVAFDTLSTVEGLEVRLTGPHGEVVTPATVASYGGDYGSYAGTGSDTPFTTAGVIHYLYFVKSLGSGNYTLSFNRPQNLSDEVPVVVIATLDSDLKVTLVPSSSTVPLGSPVTFTAAIFDDKRPVQLAQVSAIIKPPNSPNLDLILKDDGQMPDLAAGDGMYTATFVPSTTGEYSIGTSISGTLPSGAIYLRHTATSITVIQSGATLDGTVRDAAFDQNGDGVQDGIAFSVGIEVDQPARYLVSVNLTTPRGRTIATAQDAQLSQGKQTVQVNLPAQTLIRAGEDGPFTISRVSLIQFVNDTHVESARRFDSGPTQAYRLIDFKPKGSVPGDVDGDGQIGCSDIQLVRTALGKHVGELLYDGRADINGDGTVDIRDLAYVAQKLPSGTKCAQ
jgi:hypothetical protein